MRITIQKIVSGGQTGVDRAALDAALSHNVACGGWCPEGRLAEDGKTPPCYPLTVLPGADYRKRTRQNVIDSDGTVIIYFGSLSGGTEKTLLYCLVQNKPYLLIDATELSPVRAAERIQQFVVGFSIETLNIAGPRASSEPLAYNYVLKAMNHFLGSLHVS
ncbi:MAG: putative molybdenum carrier protein [Gammaproteobacteria bacterium]